MKTLKTITIMRPVMKLFCSVSLTMFCYSCADQPKETGAKKDRLFYVTKRTFGKNDTSAYTGNFKPGDFCTLICCTGFSYRNREHGIRLYLLGGRAVDDESICYALDTLGIIYSRSTVWPGHTSLITDNDSLNELISAAKDEILANPQLHCYQCRRYDQSPKLIRNAKDFKAE